VGILVVVFLATLRFTWVYVRLGVVWLWRRRLWCAIIIVAALAAAGALVLFAMSSHDRRPARGPNTGAPKRAAPENLAGDKGTGAIGAAPRPAAGSASVPPGLEGRELRASPAVDAYTSARRGATRPAETFHLFSAQEYPGIQRGKCTLGRATRSCFIVRRTETIETDLVPKAGDCLICWAGARFLDGSTSADRVVLKVRASEHRVLFRREWKAGGGTPQWDLVRVDLGDGVGQQARLRFEVTVEASGQDSDEGPFCLISDPILCGAGEASRPNVILCTIETTRRDHLSIYGYERQTCPFLQKLAAESVVFERAYVNSSWTKPSIGSFLSGLYPSQHGATKLLSTLDDGAILLPELLRKEGYATAAFCAARAVSDPAFNYDQGFDAFADESATGFAGLSREALAWLDAGRPRPFFLWLHLLEPHEPYDAPGGFRDVFDPAYAGPLRAERWLSKHTLRRMSLEPADIEYVRARYDGELLYVDGGIEGLVEQLKQRGLWDNALVVVSADHGEELYDHGDWGHGHTLYPELLGVPLMVKLPRQQHGGTRVAGLASGVDIVPTVLAAVGLPVPGHLPGVDLFGSAATSGGMPRDVHFAELWPMDPATPDRPTYAVLTDRFEYIRAEGEAGAAEMLFDLEKDPGARENIAAARPELRERFARMVEERYMTKGYVVAANGDSAGPHTVSGTVVSEAPIVRADGLRTEEGDSFEVAPDGKSLRLALKVAGDDDVVRFQTEPPNAAVTIELMLDGAAAPTELVHLGPLAGRCDGLPLAIPAQRCAVDADLNEARKYGVGKELGVYIWRTGTPHVGAAEAKPDEETLRSLKELGYL
jgi:arylsulfatase A-like enzyme